MTKDFFVVFLNGNEEKTSVKEITFGLNRIISPELTMDGFFSMASALGIKYVELRNDIRNGQIFDGLDPSDVKAKCRDHGLTIFSINALQQFNKKGPLEDKIREVRELLASAKNYGCKALVMCPVNDAADPRSEEESFEDTVTALKAYEPYFKESGVLGLVEPLGFSICSLRTKEKAVKAINQAGGTDTYKLVHDTFHHFLSGETVFFPKETGLVHISGMEEKIPMEEINDNHRVLIGPDDQMANLTQIRQMVSGGYEGIFSFEPFGPAVQKLEIAQLKKEMEASLTLVKG